MMIDGENVIVLYLEDWQKRMIKDFLGVDCDRWDVPIGMVNTLYSGPRGPFPPRSNYKKMYLTDWQMREIRDEAGMTCDFVELTKEIIPKYRVSPK